LNIRSRLIARSVIAHRWSVGVRVKRQHLRNRPETSQEFLCRTIGEQRLHRDGYQLLSKKKEEYVKAQRNAC
jgi:hypothetical protein